MSHTTKRTVYRTCPLCEATCGLELTVENGRVTKTRGDEDDVLSHGFICPKGSTLQKLHDDPDRLRKPLVREGDTWREVTWDEAFETIERRLLPILEEHGRDSLAAYLGNPNVHNLAGSLYLRPMLKATGSKQIYSASTVDQMPKHVSAGLMFGGPDRIPVPDLDRTDYLLMLGANPWASNGSLCTAPDFPGRIGRIRKRGGKVVVVDPRRTETARKVDEHLFIRPGSDAYFLMALLHVCFEEGLVSLGDVAAHVEGVDDVQALVAEFAPERVAAVTRIDAATTRRIARELAAAPTAAVYGRIGTHTVEFGTLSSWAVDALNTLTGNLDRAGGAMFPNAAHSRVRDGVPGGRGFTTGRWKSGVRGLPEVRGELPIATLPDEILEGNPRVRALITVSGNPALSAPDAGRLERALASLDFMVSVDIYRNETSRHADVILPPPSALERSHYDLAFYGLSVRNVANYSPVVLPGDAMQESEILARLTLILSGQGAKADPSMVDELLVSGVIQAAVGAKGSPAAGLDPADVRKQVEDRPPIEQMLDVMLRSGPYGDGFGANPDGLSLAKLEANPHGVDLGPLAPRIPETLATPSGRIELAPEPIVEEVGRARERLDALAAEDGLLLVGRRHVRSNNSWMHNVDVLVRGRDRCTLQIHPDDAARIGVSDGARARVVSRVGQVEVAVELDDGLMPGVVSLPHGWGHALPGTQLSVAREHAGVNSNVLTDPRPLDPLSGNAVLNGIPVQVQPA